MFKYEIKTTSNRFNGTVIARDSISATEMVLAKCDPELRQAIINGKVILFVDGIRSCPPQCGNPEIALRRRMIAWTNAKLASPAWRKTASDETIKDYVRIANELAAEIHAIAHTA